MKLTLGIGVAGLLLSVLPRPAAAQDAVVEGPGYEISEGTVLHPTVSVETGYISNVFYQDLTPVASAVVRLIGAFSIASQQNKPENEIEAAVTEEADAEEEPPPPPKYDFRLQGQLILMGYLSSNSRVRDQSDVGVALDGHLAAFPQSDFSPFLDDTFVRDARPKNFETSGSLNRDYNHLRAGFMFRPGGRALGFGARYENTIDRFESSGSSFANRLQHLIAARAEWQWLPVTKFFFDTSLGFFGSLGDSMGFKSSSMPLRVQLGVGTALTEVTTLRAHLGYGNGFYAERQSFNNVIGGVEFGYRYTQYGRVVVTFDYDFFDSLQANFYRDFALLAKVDQQFGLVVMGADGGLRLRGYRGIAPSLGADSRDDLIADLGVHAHYLYRDWLAVTGRLNAVTDQTDYRYDTGAMIDDPSFNRIEVYLGAAAAF